LAISVNAQKEIEETELSKPVQKLLKKNILVTQEWKLRKNTLSMEKKGYEVKLKDGTEAEFWKYGSYREVDGGANPISITFISGNVKDYAAKNYPEKKIIHIDYEH